MITIFYSLLEEEIHHLTAKFGRKIFITKKVTGFLRKNRKNHFNTAFSTVTHFFLNCCLALIRAAANVAILLNWCSNWLLSARKQACSLFRNARTAWSISSCDNSSQIASSTVMSSALLVGFGVNTLYRSSKAPQRWYLRGVRSGWFGDHSSFLTNSGICWSIHSWARRDEWAGASYCWNMKLLGSRLSQASMSLGSRSFTKKSSFTFTLTSLERYVWAVQSIRSKTN